MTEEISDELRKKIIKKLSKLPLKAWKYQAAHCIGGNLQNYEQSYQYHNLKQDQLFSVICYNWTSYSGPDMAGESETTTGVSYYLKIYSGNNTSNKCLFKTTSVCEKSNKEIKILYHTIDDKFQQQECRKREKEDIRALKNLEQFVKE